MYQYTIKLFANWPLGGSASVDGEKLNSEIGMLVSKFEILIINQKFVGRVIMQFSYVLNISYSCLCF